MMGNETENTIYEIVNQIPITEENRDKVILDFGKDKGKINICVSGSKYKEHIDDIFYSMYYKREFERGFEAEENHAVPGTFEIDIKPNEDKEITFLCSLDSEEYGNSIEELSRLSGTKIIENEKKRMESMVDSSDITSYAYSYYMTLQGFKILKKYCDKRKIKLVNLSCESVLDMLPRKSLEDVICNI